MYFFSKLMNYTPSVNQSFDESRILETFTNQKAPKSFRNAGIHSTFLLYNNDPLYFVIVINLI